MFRISAHSVKRFQRMRRPAILILQRAMDGSPAIV
jgi:hypothetical protein